MTDGQVGGQALHTLLPVLGALSSVTMIVVLRNSNPLFLVMGAVLLVVALVGGVGFAFSQRGQAARSRRTQRELYLDYLERLRAEMRAKARRVRERAADLDPEPAALLELVRDPASALGAAALARRLPPGPGRGRRRQLVRPQGAAGGEPGPAARPDHAGRGRGAGRALLLGAGRPGHARSGRRRSGGPDRRPGRRARRRPGDDRATGRAALSRRPAAGRRVRGRAGRRLAGLRPAAARRRPQAVRRRRAGPPGGLLDAGAGPGAGRRAGRPGAAGRHVQAEHRHQQRGAELSAGGVLRRLRPAGLDAAGARRRPRSGRSADHHGAPAQRPAARAVGRADPAHRDRTRTARLVE